MARIRFEGLGKRLGGQAVIAPLDLVIEDGEFFTFVGPSGCGKSTLLGLIAGVDAPSEGAIWFDDRRIDGLAPGARDVAMVFQSYALYPHLTVRENIGFPLRARGVKGPESAREIERVAQVLGLDTLLERKPRQLSGGQRQRVALGRALVRRPKVFLMDEPLSNLDARLRLEMREELKRLHGVDRITTVYVTHDQEEAMALSDRVAVLSAGTIQQCGAPQTIYDDPANLFVARFIGSPPINVFAGEVAARLPEAERLLFGRRPADVVVGVRPVDVQVGLEPSAASLMAEVRLVEPTGGDLWIVGAWQGHRIKGRAAPGTALERGATASFVLPGDRIYAFDAHTGARLAGVRPGAS